MKKIILYTLYLFSFLAIMKCAWTIGIGLAVGSYHGNGAIWSALCFVGIWGVGGILLYYYPEEWIYIVGKTILKGIIFLYLIAFISIPLHLGMEVVIFLSPFLILSILLAKNFSVPFFCAYLIDVLAAVVLIKILDLCYKRGQERVK